MKQSLFFLILLFCVFGCGESEPSPEPPEELIPPSEVGAGFVSCLIDGEVWNVRGINNIGSSLTAGGLIIRTGKRTESETQSLDFSITDITQEGNYALPSNGIASYSTQTVSNDGSIIAKSYQTNTTHDGQVVITKLDTEANIIAGTFLFDAIDSDTGDIIQIRDGRFDIKY